MDGKFGAEKYDNFTASQYQSPFIPNLGKLNSLTKNNNQVLGLFHLFPVGEAFCTRNK